MGFAFGLGWVSGVQYWGKELGFGISRMVNSLS